MKTLKVILLANVLLFMGTELMYSEFKISDQTRKFVKNNASDIAQKFVTQSSKLQKMITLNHLEDILGPDIYNSFSSNALQYVLGAVQAEIDMFRSQKVAKKESKIVREIEHDYSLTPQEEKVARAWIQKNQSEIVNFLKKKNKRDDSFNPLAKDLVSLVKFTSISLTYEQLKNVARNELRIDMPKNITANQIKYLVDSIQEAYDLATGNLPESGVSYNVPNFNEVNFAGYFTMEQLEFIQNVFAPYLYKEFIQNVNEDLDISDNEKKEKFVLSGLKKLRATYSLQNDRNNIDNCDLFIDVFNNPKLKFKDELLKWIVSLMEQIHERFMSVKITKLAEVVAQLNQVSQNSRSRAGIRRAGGRPGTQPNPELIDLEGSAR